MAQLTVSFTPVSGITSYEVCYVPTTGGTPTCTTASSSPVVITTGIECGVSYNVTVKTNCPEGEYQTDQSTPATTVATALDCPAENCISYTISTSAAEVQNVAYIDCAGVIQQVYVGGVGGYDATTFCAREGSVIPTGQCDLSENGTCEGNSLRVEGVSGYMEPCIGGTIDDHMGASVYLSGPVSVDTVFDVTVSWTNRGAGCTSPYEQSFSVTVLAGEMTSNFSACSQGAYIASGADICGAVVTGHNNTVDIITI
jgi:hypothetical protein